MEARIFDEFLYYFYSRESRERGENFDRRAKLFRDITNCACMDNTGLDGYRSIVSRGESGSFQGATPAIIKLLGLLILSSTVYTE